MTQTPTPLPPKDGLMKLSKEEMFILRWLAKEDSSALGECKGRSLDRLISLGLAKVSGVGDYASVSLTESGFKEADVKQLPTMPCDGLRLGDSLPPLSDTSWGPRPNYTTPIYSKTKSLPLPPKENSDE